MSTRYFRLSEDVYIPGRWDLGTPMDSQGRKFGSRVFLRGTPADIESPLRVSIDQPGEPLDFSLADMSAVPVVSEKVATLLTQLAPDDVQLFPVEVDTRPESYFIVNVTRLVKCIDDEASNEVRYWRPEDGRPDRVGTYSSVSGMRIDTTQVGTAKVFRTWGWHIALIISEDIKEALERAGVTGIWFEEVTGSSSISPEERERNRRLLELREQTDVARESFWRTLGRLDEDAIIPMVVGGSWPARRQVWRIIHRPEGRTLLVTDGLSDFFVDRAEPSVGFGLELALETDEPLKDVEKSWPLLLLERVADEVAEHERVRERLQTGPLSMEVSGKDMPEVLVTQQGRVGVLLGIEASTLPQDFAMPAGKVRLVTLKPLLPTELAYLLEHGTTGRAELVRRFSQGGIAHLSGVSRKPVA